MSGHSKWHRIKHKKAQTDHKRGKLFARLSRDISVSAQAGRDPAKNFALREAIDRAKRENLPQANIDRILSEEKETITQVMYEGYGPGGIAILIDAATDNTNRTVAELRTMFKNNNGSLGSPNSVLWKFKPSAVITADISTVTDQDQLELDIIDAGAGDFEQSKNTLTVTAEVENKESVQQVLRENGADITDAEIQFTVPPDQRLSVSSPQQKKLDQLIEIINQSPDVIAIYTDVA